MQKLMALHTFPSSSPAVPVGFGVLQCSPPPVPPGAVMGFRGLLLGQQPLLLFLSPAVASKVSPCASEAPWQWLSWP